MTENDKAKAEKIARAILGEAVTATRPMVRSMVDAIRDTMTAMANTCGEELDDSNRHYYGALGAVVMASGMTKEEAARNLVIAFREARRACQAHPELWGRVAMIRDTLSDEEEEDGPGRALGFGPLLNHDPNKPEDRADMLAQCADYYGVPGEHRERIGELVTSIAGNSDLPVSWANLYALTVYAMAAGCGFPPGVVPEGGHNFARH